MGNNSEFMLQRFAQLYREREGDREMYFDSLDVYRREILAIESYCGTLIGALRTVERYLEISDQEKLEVTPLGIQELLRVIRRALNEQVGPWPPDP